MKFIIANNEIGLLFRNQIFKKILETGEYNYSKFFKNHVYVINKKNAIEKYNIEIKALKNNKILLKMVDTINVKDNELSFHFVDGLYYEILPAGTYSFFNDIYQHTFITCDTKNVFIPETIDPSIFKSQNYQYQGQYNNLVTDFTVNDGYVGALIINGKFNKFLDPGKYYFFTNINAVNVKQIDLRNRSIQISGQELLTKDKVTLRMNFVLSFKVTDPFKVATTYEDFEQQLYLTMQLALREYVSTKTLDDLLAEKHEIGKIILNSVKAKENEFGTIFIEAGLKDIILPGEIKDILNTVLIAEKKALANVITRREETASTRSLLNTAKLMEENETLYKLKELEYLEKICDKVGNISLSSSGGILEQLSELLKKR